MKQVGKLTSGECGKTIIIICCFNAAGTYIPPALIFPCKNMNDRLVKGAVDLDSVIEDFIRLNDQRKDDFGL